VLQAEDGAAGFEWCPCCRLKMVRLGLSGVRVAG